MIGMGAAIYEVYCEPSKTKCTVRLFVDEESAEILTMSMDVLKTGIGLVVVPAIILKATDVFVIGAETEMTGVSIPEALQTKTSKKMVLEPIRAST